MKIEEKNLVTNKQSRPVVDSLLAQITEKATLAERINWLVNLFRWIREDRGISANSHLRFISTVLERNLDLKLRVAKTIRSIVKDINAFDLFVSTGIAGQNTFLLELTTRLSANILPANPHYDDFAEIFHLLFPKPDDAKWILEIDHPNLHYMAELLSYEVAADETTWNSIFHDIEEAIYSLSRQVQVISFTPAIRKRIGKNHIVELACYKMDHNVSNALASRTDKAKLSQERERFQLQIQATRQDLKSAYQHLEEEGVSVGLVYNLERIQAQLRRLEILVDILTGDDDERHEKLKLLFHELAILADEQRSVGALIRENMALLSRKIVENNAEIGDHYIARTRSEYMNLILTAMGGGLITCLMIVCKVNLEHLELNLFFKGLLVSCNYASGFVLIQMLGFTLATKQPAMTAAALAAKIKQLLESKDYSGLISEVIYLVRSQFVAIAGNVIAVCPAIILVDYLSLAIWQKHLIDPEYAMHIIDSHSVLGITPLFAAITGVILWISSICAGWINNWFLYRELGPALAVNPTLNQLFGRQGAHRLSEFFKRNIAGLGGNISLGFLLGLMPKVVAFFGIGMDVRHVTLATGSVALALAVAGPQIGFANAVIFAIVGLVVIGMLNVGVSFGLALWVAVYSQRLKVAQSVVLYRKIIREFVRHPWRFLLP